MNGNARIESDALFALADWQAVFIDTVCAVSNSSGRSANRRGDSQLTLSLRTDQRPVAVDFSK